jgi:Zn-finger in Ran binding protein and others
MSAAPSADPSMGFGFGYPPSGPPMMPNYGHGHGHGHGHGPPNPSKSMGGSAPFRPGDWRCGVPDCMYHNFAKNLTCLRCGGSRANAIPMTGPNQFVPPPHYNHQQMGGFMDHSGPQGGPPPSGPPPMGVPPGAFSGGAGGGPYPPGGFGPSAMGYPNPSGGFDPLGAVGYAPGVLPPGTGFDSRAEAAFSGAHVGHGGHGGHGHGGPGQQGGPPGFGSAGPANGGAAGGSAFDGGADPFGFLGAGLAGLSLDESSGRRNGAHGTGGPAGKSPAA